MNGCHTAQFKTSFLFGIRYQPRKCHRYFGRSTLAPSTLIENFSVGAKTSMGRWWPCIPWLCMNVSKVCSVWRAVVFTHSVLLQLGIGSTVDQHAPSFVSSLNMGVLCVSLGQDFSCAINIYGKLYCWGYNFKNQVGALVVASFVVAPVPNHSCNICSSAIIQAFLPGQLPAWWLSQPIFLLSVQDLWVVFCVCSVCSYASVWNIVLDSEHS